MPVFFYYALLSSTKQVNKLNYQPSTVFKNPKKYSVGTRRCITYQSHTIPRTINNWVDKTASPLPPGSQPTCNRCAAIRTQLVLCALRIYICCLNWCARKLHRNVYLMNRHPVPPPPPERIAPDNYCVRVVAGRQHSKSLHHHERICDAWTASPLDAGSHTSMALGTRRCSTRVLNLWFALEFNSLVRRCSVGVLKKETAELRDTKRERERLQHSDCDVMKCNQIKNCKRKDIAWWLERSLSDRNERAKMLATAVWAVAGKRFTINNKIISWLR